MKPFTYYQPTRLFFGCGQRHQAGNIIGTEARKILLVADPGLINAAPDMVRDVRHSLNEAGVTFVEYDQVTPNPTLEDIQTGAELAQKEGVEACLGMGGGSAIDTAKAIAVAATHPGTAWDYLYYKQAPTNKTLPIFSIATTSGTGTQTSKVSVFTNTAKNKKSAMWNDHLLCRAAIIDPEIMLTLPPRITASTGFDVFTHAFESLINVNSIVFVDLLAIEAIALVIKNLPAVVKDGSDIECRSKIAWADTLAGMCLANVGTTLPHAAGQPLSGHFPHISHGESLAVVYPAFAEFTCSGAPAKFAQVARLFNPALKKQNDEAAAASFQDEIEAFLESIGLRCYLEDFGITRDNVEAVLDHAMEFPDHTVNPVPPTREDMWNIYQKSFRK